MEAWAANISFYFLKDGKEGRIDIPINETEAEVIKDQMDTLNEEGFITTKPPVQENKPYVCMWGGGIVKELTLEPK